MTEPKINFIPEECKGWKIDGVMYPVLESAQRAALEKVLVDFGDSPANAADCILKNRAEVMAILSLEAPKQRKPRCDKGTSRTKKIAPLPQTKKWEAINAELQDGKQ